MCCVLEQDDLSSYIDYMLNVGEKLFNQKALPLAPVRLGAAQEYVWTPSTHLYTQRPHVGPDRQHHTENALQDHEEGDPRGDAQQDICRGQCWQGVARGVDHGTFTHTTHTRALRSQANTFFDDDDTQAAKANNEAVNAFLHPYEPLQEIVDEAIAEIHRELGPKE